MKATPRGFLAATAAAVLAVPLVLTGAASSSAAAHVPDPARDAARLSRKLVRAASAEGAYRHLTKFQAIADSSGGHRAAGSPGHDASAGYVYDRLRKAGYQVSYDTFDFTYIETLAEKLLVTVAGAPQATPRAGDPATGQATVPAPREVGIVAMSYTKSTPVGGVTAPLAAVPADATTGCEAADYASGSFTGRIALIRRGGCDFASKQREAAAAGAVAAIIYNNTEGALSGTLGTPAAGVIPTGGITLAEGQALATEAAEAAEAVKTAGTAADTEGAVTATVEVRQLQEPRTTRNVIAETRDGDPHRTVMLGAHLDSVVQGPGINDNGSGSAALLDVALALADTDGKPANKVRFAWWSGEELGLLGSEAYVTGRTAEQRADIALYLNFDMIASSNFAEFVYDGDDSDGGPGGPGPRGSAQLEKDIGDFLDHQGRPHEGADFDGRSDYGPFIAAGIPSGGTFTGAEGIKSPAQAHRYGGEAGVAYDTCYHAACDDLAHINRNAFDLNIDVIAHAVGTYAHDLGALSRPR
ncbi:M28 family peptidase [Streptomyces sp. NPDC051569]|uniref:M28 family peptidase n=1 Tax=Streptomyces sp. NPDC051569 TaxID=3365661 RepID=UPI0037BB4B31